MWGDGWTSNATYEGASLDTVEVASVEEVWAMDKAEPWARVGGGAGLVLDVAVMAWMIETIKSVDFGD